MLKKETRAEEGLSVDPKFFAEALEGEIVPLTPEQIAQVYGGSGGPPGPPPQFTVSMRDNYRVPDDWING